MIFDSHAHYYDEKFDGIRESIYSEIRSAGVAYVLNAGTNPDTSRKCLSLARENQGFFASVGVHPEEIDGYCDIDTVLEAIKALATDEKAIAIGEIGLDYHFRSDNKKEQAEWFYRQMCLAKELDMPVIVHDREAHGDCFDIIKQFPEVKGVFHSFSGSREFASELLKKGWYISFSGVITFKNATRLAEVVPYIPDDRILVETDCPYLAPHPLRGQVNNSALMLYTIDKMAELRCSTRDEIIALTLKNTARLFPKAGIGI